MLDVPLNTFGMMYHILLKIAFRLGWLISSTNKN